jgi:hypothetical protein
MPTYEPRHRLAEGVEGAVNTADEGRARFQVLVGGHIVLDVLVPHSAAKGIASYGSGGHPSQDALLEALVAASHPTTIP